MEFWSKMFGSVLHIGNAVNLLPLIVPQIDGDIYTDDSLLKEQMREPKRVRGS